MPFPEIIATLKDILLAGAGITGAIVAVKGLGTWKNQLKGQHEYELSRRFLVSIYKYRDAINGVRHPAMWGYEMPAPPEEEATSMSHEKIRYYGLSKAYQARWEKVQTQKSSLYADVLEAEAIWGDELKAMFKELHVLEVELSSAVERHLILNDPDARPDKKAAIQRLDQEKREILWDDLADKPDAYKKDFTEVLERIEKYLKPKLTYN